VASLVFVECSRGGIVMWRIWNVASLFFVECNRGRIGMWRIWNEEGLECNAFGM
jgi:hypothetical protein